MILNNPVDKTDKVVTVIDRSMKTENTDNFSHSKDQIVNYQETLTKEIPEEPGVVQIPNVNTDQPIEESGTWADDDIIKDVNTYETDRILSNSTEEDCNNQIEKEIGIDISDSFKIEIDHHLANDQWKLDFMEAVGGLFHDTTLFGKNEKDEKENSEQYTSNQSSQKEADQSSSSICLLYTSPSPRD